LSKNAFLACSSLKNGHARIGCLLNAKDFPRYGGAEARIEKTFKKFLISHQRLRSAVFIEINLLSILAAHHPPRFSAGGSNFTILAPYFSLLPFVVSFFSACFTFLSC